ncbi:hypothetical protein FPZ24_01450 [Sphingomonas panacisoli]|uniref:Invasion associated locus B family protein n=1 Tax=Sphingomonas panacisoli TaxID=1813879 RepID=A0A5B8LDZ1_9SPHN|nr:hypothetical protein [Sphingomonas panacisoli]QDZ06301.1 hypothetical protein FPZ24_01450 [Sphingomonas panacisoli]
MISILSLLLQTAAAPAPAPAPAPAAAPVAPWTVVVRPKTDPAMTTTVVSAPASDGSGRLVVKCDSGAQQVVSVQFLSKTALGGPPDRPVTLTIDGGTPMGANWEFVEKGAFIRDDMAVTTITAALATSKAIKLATTTAAGVAVNATFAGPPSAAPITKVLAACGYTLGTPPVRAPQPAPTPAAK